MDSRVVEKFQTETFNMAKSHAINGCTVYDTRELLPKLARLLKC